MSREDWEVFDVLKAERKERKRRRRDEVAKLHAQGVMSGWIKRNDTHYQIRLPKGFLDWWPGTLKFRYNHQTMYGSMNKVFIFVEDNRAKTGD